MTDLFLAPHNDDETLFGSFVCQRYKPLVIVCLRSFAQERVGINYQTREQETKMACAALGVEYVQWLFGDHHVNWSQVEESMHAADRQYAPERVWAPAYDFERNGWSEGSDPIGYGLYHHDRIGAMAGRVFGERAIYYTNYLRWEGRDEDGIEVVPSSQQIAGKLAALRCYQSQIAETSTQEHFMGSMREWIK